MLSCFCSENSTEHDEDNLHEDNPRVGRKKINLPNNCRRFENSHRQKDFRPSQDEDANESKEPPDLITIAETLPRTESFDHTHILNATLFRTLDEGFLFNLFNFYVFKIRNELAYENYGRIFLNKIGLKEG